MTVPSQHGRGRLLGRLLAAVLALAALIPAGVLFSERWQTLDDRLWDATHAGHGVEYIVGLADLTGALTQAQTAAIIGQPVPRPRIDRTVAQVEEVNHDYGHHLRVQGRWRDLEARIQRVTATFYADPADAYAAFGETTDLLLELYDKVREVSGLARDPDPDLYYLQDSAVEELPETLVAAGRLADLVALAPAESDPPATDPAEVDPAGTDPEETEPAGTGGQDPATQDPATQEPGDEDPSGEDATGEDPAGEGSGEADDPAEADAVETDLALARADVAAPAGDLASDLQAALESTTGRTLDNAVLSDHDRFLREKDALLSAVPADGQLSEIAADEVARAWGALHSAGDTLLDTLLAELATVLSERRDRLAGEQLTSAIMGASAVGIAAALLYLIAVGVALPGRRESHPAPPAPEPGTPAGPVGAEAGDPAGAVAGNGGRGQPRWERSGAR